MIDPVQDLPSFGKPAMRCFTDAYAEQKGIRISRRKESEEMTALWPRDRHHGTIRAEWIFRSRQFRRVRNDLSH
ncbi:hypothetical protein [Pseudoxanthomonas wuyuanensis]